MPIFQRLFNNILTFNNCPTLVLYWVWTLKNGGIVDIFPCLNCVISVSSAGYFYVINRCQLDIQLEYC